jgi:DNA processing protein
MDAVDLQLILGRAPHLTAHKLRRALQRIGCVPPGTAAIAALVGESAARLQQLGLPPTASRWLAAPDHALIQADRRWLERRRVVIIDAFSCAYPPRLAALHDAAAVLFVRGDAGILAAAQFAIVGCRGATLSGRRTAREFAAQLSCAGLTITSGLALGIDAAGHEGALQAGGQTVAVLGSGLEQVYPHCHGPLAERIVAHGALVSELPRDALPEPWSFPRRNRLISGLSLGTLVVEATENSGSLITARLALAQRRPLFAVPGPIHSPQARGCHQLIRNGARLVESASDILREISGFLPKQADMSPFLSRDRVTSPGARLDKGQKILLDAFGSESASIDALVERTGFPSHSVASMLLILELQGAIGEEEGGRYVRLRDERHG